MRNSRARSKKILRDNGLSLTLVACFLMLWLGQAVTGLHEHNREAQLHGQAPISFDSYLLTPHFLEATFENWESEFLQMAVYVVFTVFLYQRGSAESKDPDKREAVDADPRSHRLSTHVPWMVRLGGWRLKLYEHSLSLALFGLFLLSWLGHARAGFAEFNDQQAGHGQPSLSFGEYLGASRFWFESFQNWQSEFLAVATIVILSIWLREKGSAESKPVASAHSDTGK